MKEIILAPSLLSADFSNLQQALSFIEQKNGSWVHIDVMDGTFVPQISYGQPVVKSLRRYSSLPFDVHLMTEHPETQIESFASAGADYLTFHIESTIHVNRVIQKIHELGKKAGVALVPSTPVAILSEVLPFADLILVMSVNPGFGGQKIIPSCIDKIVRLNEIRSVRGYNYKISVDGGINEKNITDVCRSGVDVIVSGSAFFAGKINWER